MPSPEEILEGLHEIANRWRALAVLWHAYLGAGLVAWLFGVRPRRRSVGMYLVLPLFSVSALAWAHANPFNGVFFAVLGVALFAISATFSRESARLAGVWPVVSGLLMFVFGWTYPHFLDGASPLTYSYAAPTGLIPCPTLSIVIGMSLMLGGLGSRPWSLVLAASGIFYGIFGTARLDVAIDAILLAGAFSLIATAFSRRFGAR